MQLELQKNKTIQEVYENEEFLPCFVYGTLKKKYHNHRLLDGNYEKYSEGHIKGYEIFSSSPDGQGIPAVRGSLNKNEIVHGELYFIDKDKYISTLKNLDRLESYNPLKKEGFYERNKIKVITDDGTFDAWIYLCEEDYFRHKIKSGIY